MASEILEYSAAFVDAWSRPGGPPADAPDGPTNRVTTELSVIDDGLAMVEAGACGTPVIAFNRGSVQEVVKDEKTGFIVNNSAEMILAIEKLPTIKRKDCRDHVVKNFSLTTMIDGYEEVLTRIVSENAKPKKPQPDQGTPARISQKVIRISKRLLNS